MTLVGMGGLINEKDLNKALDTCFSEFIGIGYDRMTNRDLDILLKENRGKEIREEIEPEYPEIYWMPDPLLKMSLEGINYFSTLKGKPVERLDDV